METEPDKERKEGKEMNSLYKRLSIVVLALLVLSLGLILYSSIPLITGKTVVLKTEPIDPFDIFRGQYLTINYNISFIPKINGLENGDTVYVTLRKEGDIYVYDSASETMPSKEKVFLKGEVAESFRPDTTIMHVRYGIESYFFERNAQINTTNMTVEVKVAGNGVSRINRLLHDGKPLVINYTRQGFG